MSLLQIETTIRTQLAGYFNSPASQRADNKRFTALQVILKDLATAVRTGKASSYGISMPTDTDISRITDCSTCPGKAGNTAIARSRCEQFARTWLRISDPEKVVSGTKPATPVQGKSKNGTKKKGGNPTTVFFNIQAFK